MAGSEISICPHCGAKNRVYRIPLTSGVVSIVVKMYDVIKAKSLGKHHNENVVNKRELRMSHSQYTNISHPRYFGLIAKKLDENGKPVSGSYVITRWGYQFLKHGREIPKYAWIFRNKLQRREGDMVAFNRLYKKGMPLEWETVFDWEPAELFQPQPELEFNDGGGS